MKDRALVMVMVGCALACPTLAWSSSTCTAYPTSTPTLESCLRTISDGGTISLADGVHRLGPTVIDKRITLAPLRDGRPVIQHHRLIGSDDVHDDILPIEEVSLVEASPLFTVSSGTAHLTLQGVQLAPATSGLTFGEDTLILARLIEISAGGATLDDVHFIPYPSIEATGGYAAGLSEIGAVNPGGVLARVSAGGQLVLDGVRVSDLRAPTLRGAVVDAVGSGTRVEIAGSTNIERVRSRHGAISVAEGAELAIRASGGVKPRLAELRGRFGGALHAEGATVEVVGATFRDNGYRRTGGPEPLTLCGGDLFQIGGSASLSDVSSVGGHALLGGSVCAQLSALDVVDSTFTNGRARRGGAIWHQWTSREVDSLRIERSSFLDNRVQPVPLTDDGGYADDGHTWGGALYMDSAKAEITGSTFESNTAVGGSNNYGGAILARSSSLSVAHSEISGNLGSRGAGVAAYSSDLWLRGTDIESNGGRSSCTTGGGLALDGGSLSLVGVELVANACEQGGGLWANDLTEVEIRDSTFSGNQADLSGGARVLAGSGLIEESRFDGNHASEGTGGHLSLRGSSSMPASWTISSSTFEAGLAADGGAISIVSASVEISESTFAGNRADGRSGEGGAIHAGLGAVLSLSKTLFTKNIGRRGGAVRAGLGSAFSADESEFLDNEAEVGGALLLHGSGAPALSRSLFCENQADEGQAVLIDSEGHSMALLRNNLFGGPVSSSEALVRLQGASARVEQSAIIAGEGPSFHVDGGVIELASSVLFSRASGSLAPVVLTDGAELRFEGGLLWHPDGEPLAVSATGPLPDPDGLGREPYVSITVRHFERRNY